MRTILFVLAVAVSAGAQQTEPAQPYDVNGMTLGSAFSDWKKGAGAQCSDWDRVEPDVTTYSCPELTYAGVRMEEIVNFYDGKLMSIYLVLSHRDFSRLRAALKQKFGQPWRTEQKAYDLDGITLNGEHNRWSNGVTSINLAEYGPDRDRSVLFFAHMKIMAEKNRNAKAKAGGAESSRSRQWT
jgi:hypothetical protein